MGAAQRGGAKVLPPLHFQLSRYTLIEQSATLIEQSCPNKHLNASFSKIQSPLLPKSISEDYSSTFLLKVFPQTPLIEHALHGKNASHSQPAMLLKPFMQLINFCYLLLHPCMSHMLCNTLKKGIVRTKQLVTCIHCDITIYTAIVIR